MTQAEMTGSTTGADRPSRTFATHDAQGERPVGDILHDLWEHAQVLVTQEIKLASVELDEKIAKAKADLVAPIVGGAVLYLGVLALVAAIILLLAQAVAPWVAAFIVGVVMSAIGYGLLKRTPDLAQLTPKRSPRSIKTDVQTFKEAIK
jgi:uncharacterized protein YacL